MRPTLVLAAVLALLAAAPSLALADETITAASPNRYLNPAVTIEPGERLTFRNTDPFVRHDVTATAEGADGAPLFSTPVISNNQEVVVAGAERLAPGAYRFLCSLHPNQMRGEVTVTGTAGDARPPALSAAVGAASVRAILRRGRLSAAVTLDEAAATVLTARARGVTLARRSVSLAAGTTRVALRLTARGRRALRGRSQVRVTLSVRARARRGQRRDG